jgi:hypothetical protein
MIKLQISHIISSGENGSTHPVGSGVTEEEGAPKHIWCGGPC